MILVVELMFHDFLRLTHVRFSDWLHKIEIFCWWLGFDSQILLPNLITIAI